MSTDFSVLPSIRGRTWNPILLRLLHHRLFVTGALLLLFVLIATLGADYLAPYSPLKNDFRYRLGAPNAVHPFGTDNFGRDVLSRVLFGGRTSITIGALVVITTTLIGTFVGKLARSFPR